MAPASAAVTCTAPGRFQATRQINEGRSSSFRGTDATRSGLLTAPPARSSRTATWSRYPPPRPGRPARVSPWARCRARYFRRAAEVDVTEQESRMRAAASRVRESADAFGDRHTQPDPSPGEDGDHCQDRPTTAEIRP